jgi:hypothetical protein
MGPGMMILLWRKGENMSLAGDHLVLCPGEVKGHEHCWERDESEREGFEKWVGKKRNWLSGNKKETMFLWQMSQEKHRVRLCVGGGVQLLTKPKKGEGSHSGLGHQGPQP